jgi:hypothetical protein
MDEWDEESDVTLYDLMVCEARVQEEIADQSASAAAPVTGIRGLTADCL